MRRHLRERYNRLSGYKFVRDKRGFDILPDGTHGTSGFMSSKEQALILDTGSVADLDSTALGKLKAEPEDDDRYADYVALRKNCGLTEHTMAYGATGSGKSRGFVKPFILQCARRKESLFLADFKGEFYETMSGFLRSQGYEVRLFNLLDMEHSDAWNCLANAGSDPNLVQSIAEVIINNTSGNEDRQDFWSKAEMNLPVVLLHYVRRLQSPAAATTHGASAIPALVHGGIRNCRGRWCSCMKNTLLWDWTACIIYSGRITAAPASRYTG